MMTIAEQWEQQGLEKGMEKGRQEGEAKVLLRLVQVKFGPPEPAVAARIAAADSAQVERWLERERVADALKAHGIPTAVYYPKCLHEQPVFAALGYQWGDFPEAERASREVLSLPMHPGLTEREQERVVAVLEGARRLAPSVVEVS